MEDYNDVFADIVNGFLFKGKQVVLPSDLRNGNVHSQYKADNRKLHEQERDVLKEWASKKVNIAICGIENQTNPDKFMPMRILGYDGASYRGQLLKKNPKPVPVVTLVLYFGTEKRWTNDVNLKSLFDIPDGLDEYISDYKINVFEVAWLTDKELNRFKSDFKVIANYLVNKRKDKDYIPDDTTKIKHLEEVLKLISVMTNDESYEKILELPPSKRKGVDSMRSVAQNLLSIGEAKGKAEGQSATVYKFVSNNIITPSVGAKELGISVKKLKSDMDKAGYKYPEK